MAPMMFFDKIISLTVSATLIPILCYEISHNYIHHEMSIFKCTILTKC